MTATVTRIGRMRDVAAYSDTVSASDLVERADISYRQLDYWTRTGRLVPVRRGGHIGSGYERGYPRTEVAVACLMGRLVHDGMTPTAAHDHARALVETGTTRIGGLPVHLPTDL